MMRKLTLTLAALFLLPLNSPAQNYEAMLQQQLQQSAMLAQQMQQAQADLVQRNMQNPQVQAMYQQHLAQGGSMSFDQFAYNYAATGGFTAEGKARYFQNEQNIQRRDQAAMNDYRANQAANAQALQQMHERNNQIAHQRGNLLNGTTDYVDPSTGSRYNLPHTAQPGDVYQDPNSGDPFAMDQHGDYYRGDNDGSWYGLEEEQ